MVAPTFELAFAKLTAFLREGRPHSFHQVCALITTALVLLTNQIPTIATRLRLSPKIAERRVRTLLEAEALADCGGSVSLTPICRDMCRSPISFAALRFVTSLGVFATVA